MAVATSLFPQAFVLHPSTGLSYRRIKMCGYDRKEMSFVPGEGSTVPDIDSAVGSGISIAPSSGGVDFISTFLVAGGGISITPSLVNKSVTIAGTGGPVGVSVVQSGNGSGIEAVDVSGVVTLTGQYVAGTGLQMVPSGINKTVTINNLQTISSDIGSGIKVTQTGSDFDIATLLAPAGAGISITPSTTTNGISIGNTGVTKLVGGAGLGVSAATGNVTLTNTGVTNLVAGPNISLSGSTGAVTISASGGTSGLTNLTGGTGIAISGASPVLTVSNTGVTQLTAGNNMLVSASSGSVILAAKVARPMSFSLSGVPPITNGPPSNFPIAVNNFGNFSLNTLTTFGDLLAGIGDFIGVNTGTVIMDMSSFNLSMVTGQPGNISVYVSVIGTPGSGLLVQTIYPSNPSPSISESTFSLGLLTFTMEDFRTAFGVGGGNASISVGIFNQNANTVYVSAGYPLNYIAWYWPDTTY
jgi:hypothetical protein